MERPATWKVVTVGVAMTGLGIVGAATASAATSPAPLAVAGIEAPQFTGIGFGDVAAMGDDWTETYWDNGWNHVWNNVGDDWTDTYWDD